MGQAPRGDRAYGESFGVDGLVTHFTDPVGASGQTLERGLDLTDPGLRLHDQRLEHLPLESDGGAFGVVLIIDVGAIGGLDDLITAHAESGELGQGLLARCKQSLPRAWPKH